jgi:YidC/Oxa1 family membrane protein insertase
MPVWIALYQSIMRVMAVIPENLAGLSQYLYSWDVVYSALPLNNHFLWFNLASGDMVLALLVGASMWVQQKMVQAPVTDPSQKTQSSIMLWMLPIMFAWLSMSFPSGLALYWVTSNLFRIGVQYFIGGWGSLIKSSEQRQPSRDKKYKQRIAAAEQGGTDVAPRSTQEEDTSYEESGDKRPDGGGGYTKSLRNVKPRSRRGRSHRPKRG